MSTFWSWYITLLTVGTLIALFWLIFATRKGEVHKSPTEQTMGHAFDGIEEYDNPLPKWWFMLFLGTLIFSSGYLVLYPGLGNNKGTLNWSSKGQLEAEIAKAKVEEEKIYAAFRPAAVEDLARDPKALAIGERLFLNNCAACHGSDAKGSKGFPNLTDTDWLHGGSPEKISETLHAGRNGMMPPMAAAVGGPEEVRQVANYVLSLSGSGHNSILAELGKDKFKAACATCHGADGKGMQALGAPNLTDKIWLHGWGEEAIVRMINNGKVNVMPAQAGRLTEDQIKVLTAYVWGLSRPTQTAQAQ